MSKLASHNLEARLPRYSTGAVEARRALCQTPRIRQTSSATVRITGEPSNRCVANHWVRCDGPGWSAWLALEHDGHCAPVADREWWDYESSEQQLLAWAIAHETVLAGLSELLGDQAVPTQLTSVEPEHANDDVMLQFELRDTVKTTCGRLVADVVASRRMLANSAGTSTDGARWAAPIVLRVSALVNVLHDELRKAGPGDVIVIGDQGTWNQLVLCGHSPVGCADIAVASLSKTSLTVQRLCPNPTLNGDITMTESAQKLDLLTDREEKTRPDSERASSTLERIHARVEFQVGTLELPVQAVTDLQPGYVFELAEPIESTTIAIRINGRQVGTGKLVMAGDKLGVQLVDWP